MSFFWTKCAFCKSNYCFQFDEEVIVIFVKILAFKIPNKEVANY